MIGLMIHTKNGKNMVLNILTNHQLTTLKLFAKIDLWKIQHPKANQKMKIQI